MISSWRKRLHRQTWHPSSDDLLLYLDGELGSKTDQFAAHTKACWSCRSELQEIDRTISRFMEARNASFGNTPGFPTHAVPKFAAKLDRLEAELSNRSLLPDGIRRFAWRGLASRIPTRLAVFVTSLVLMGVILFHVAQPVSAKQVLFQIQRAEARQMLRVSKPVVYQKLSLSRRSQKRTETATWEIWSDTGNRRFRQQTETNAALLNDFDEVSKSHGADPQRPLSTTNYQAWRSAIPRQSEEVIESRLPNGDRAAILKVSGQGPFPPGAVVGAEFIVRLSDWHPVGQRLLVQERGESVNYSLGEIAFDVMALNRVPASIFTSPAPAPAAASPEPTPDLTPEITSPATPAPPSESDLMESEVDAVYAVHSVKACMGRLISVQTRAGRVEVGGIVDTEERKARILAALQGIPSVSADIRSLEAAAQGPADSEPRSLPDASPADNPPAKAKLATEDLLKRYFLKGKCSGVQGACVQDEIAKLSREALGHSEDAYAHAWALRRLVDWQPFRKRDELRASTRRLLEIMIRDHMDALSKEIEESRKLLRPILSALPTNSSSEIREEAAIARPDKESDWVVSSLLRLCDDAGETVNLTLNAFTETNRPANQPEWTAQDLLSKLDALHHDLPLLSSQLSGPSESWASGKAANQSEK